MKKNCEECGNVVGENFDFCPFCSNPLSDRAKMLEQQKMINAQLVLIAQLVKEIEDPKTLCVLTSIAKKLCEK